MTATTPTEQEAIDSAEGVGKVGTRASLAVHHMVLAGGEPARTVADALHGLWLGHPLHPVLTDVTIGSWTLGTFFDAVGAATNSPTAKHTADQLILAGTIASIPTALTGLTDFSTFPDRSANTVTWHAMLNSANLGLYLWSLRERRRGNHGRGALISSAALALTCVSAWLGGRLVYKEQVGVNHAESFDEPEQWTAVLDADKLSEGKLKRIDVGGKGVLLYRKGQTIDAIGSVCSHAGGPLEDGKVRDGCVTCPWHDSVFKLSDGSVVHGPATQPQPRFQTRTRHGRIEIRLSPDEAK